MCMAVGCIAGVDLRAMCCLQLLGLQSQGAILAAQPAKHAICPRKHTFLDACNADTCPCNSRRPGFKEPSSTSCEQQAARH